MKVDGNIPEERAEFIKLVTVGAMAWSRLKELF